MSSGAKSSLREQIFECRLPFCDLIINLAKRIERAVTLKRHAVGSTWSRKNENVEALRVRTRLLWWEGGARRER